MIIDLNQYNADYIKIIEEYSRLTSLFLETQQLLKKKRISLKMKKLLIISLKLSELLEMLEDEEVWNMIN